MTNEPNFIAGQESEGKVGALIAWALFILSIPSANVLVLIGLVVSYVSRGTATGVARQHIDAQIALFWSVFWWTIAVWIGIIVSAVASHILVVVGLIVAYAARSGATGLAREHIEAQIALFWSVFWWTIVLWVLIIVSSIASIILIGIPFLLVFIAAWFLLSVWFTVKSVLGLINLLQDRPA